MEDTHPRFAVSVVAIPPVKQTPADAAERDRQALWRAGLAEACSGLLSGRAPFRRPARLRLLVRYERGRGRSDAANILGGIADQLERLGVNENDAQVIAIDYAEVPSPDGTDRYRVEVAPV